MITYADIENLTNEEAVALYGHLTINNIDCGELENWLDNAGLASRNPISSAWQGPLVDVMAQGGPLGDGLGKLFSHLNKPRSISVDTSVLEWAYMMHQLLAGLQQASVITSDQAAGLVLLGGGYKHAGFNAAYVQSLRDAHAAEIAAEEARAAAEAASEEARATAEAERSLSELTFASIESLTNSEAVAKYAGITFSSIDCGALENWLDEEGLAIRNPVTSAWQGPVVDLMVSDSAAGGALGAGLEALFSHLNKPRSVSVDTNTAEWGKFFYQLVIGLQLVSAITSDQAAALYSLAGGARYPGLDEAYIQSIRDNEGARLVAMELEAEAEVARQAYAPKIERYQTLYHQHITPLMNNTSLSDSDWVAALQAMSDEFAVVVETPVE